MLDTFSYTVRTQLGENGRRLPGNQYRRVQRTVEVLGCTEIEPGRWAISYRESHWPEGRTDVAHVRATSEHAARSGFYWSYRAD